MKLLLVATILSFSAVASERPNVHPNMSSLAPARLESASCKNTYVIKASYSTIVDKLRKCDELEIFSPEYRLCQDQVYKSLGKLDPATTLEIVTNPRNEAAEHDVLKETLNLAIKTKGKVIYQRTTVGLFNSSGGEMEGNSIRFEEVMNENAGVIDTDLMDNDYATTTITANLDAKGYFYFTDCKFKWEATPAEEEY